HCGAPYQSESEPNTMRSGPRYFMSCPSMCAHTLGNVTTHEAKVVPISAYTFFRGAEFCANSVSQRRSGTPLRSFPARIACSASASKKRGPKQAWRSEEHTSELQSRVDLVCRLLLEKKNK